MSISNGHVSSVVNDIAMKHTQSAHSESDLSDLQEAQISESHHANGQDEVESMDDTMHDMATSESDEEEDAEGEDDADFDIETPSVQNGTLRRESSSSHDSSHPTKRKASVDDDEFMLQNPELYGLRRSVRIRSSHARSMANILLASTSPFSTSRRFS